MSEPDFQNQSEFLRTVEARAEQLRGHLAYNPRPEAREEVPKKVSQSKWNVISIISPFLGFVAAIVSALSVKSDA
jgi:hypothetical protein